jgi:hypothetical protein
MRAIVSSPTSLWRRHVFLQRLSPFGQWVNVAALMLGPQNGRIFRPAGYLPTGPSRDRKNAVKPHRFGRENRSHAEPL